MKNQSNKSSEYLKRSNGEQKLHGFLSATETEMALLINNTEESFVLVDTEYRIVIFNLQFSRLYKKYLDLDVKKGDLILDYSVPEKRDTIRETYNKVFQGKEIDAEITINDSGGLKRVFSLKYKPATDSKGKIIGASVSALDITDKAVTRQLEKLELELMGETIKVGCDIAEVLGNFIKGLEAVFPGMKASVLKVENNKIWNLASPSFPETYITGLEGSEIGPDEGSCGRAAYIRDKVIVSDISTDKLWKDIREMALAIDLKACWSQPVFNSENEVIATFGIYYDVPRPPSDYELTLFNRFASLLSLILENHQKSAEAFASNERFLKVSEAAYDAIWDWDIVNDKLYWGDGFNKLFGYDTANKELGVDFWKSCVHKDDLPEVMDAVQELMDDPGINKIEKEYRYLKVDGEYAYVVDRVIASRNEEGEIIRLVGAMSDVTKQKQYEASLKEVNEMLEKQTQELADSNAELEQFAYIASHDLQEPLRMITSFLGMFEREYGKTLDEKALTYINFALDGGRRMRQIILDLLEFSMVGKNEEEHIEVSVEEIVNEVTILYRSTIDEKKAEITTGNLPVIISSKGVVLQIFQNLIGNALKYTKDGVSPEIHVDTEDKGTHWQFMVRDNGIGISDAYFEKVFVIFQRLHNKEKYQGTGLGLAIVKKLVDILNGTIWLESEVGKGATFFFTIQKEVNRAK
jgi:PAS domain S-box-containing protein